MKSKRTSKSERSLLEDQQRTLKKIGARIKALRKKKGYSNYERFAFEKEIDRAQYGRFENGANMQITTLVKVLRALDVSIIDFFSEGFDD